MTPSPSARPVSGGAGKREGHRLVRDRGGPARRAVKVAARPSPQDPRSGGTRPSANGGRCDLKQANVRHLHRSTKLVMEVELTCNKREAQMAARRIKGECMWEARAAPLRTGGSTNPKPGSSPDDPDELHQSSDAVRKSPPTFNTMFSTRGAELPIGTRGIIGGAVACEDRAVRRYRWPHPPPGHRRDTGLHL